MRALVVFPGAFSPATVGHLIAAEFARDAAAATGAAATVIFSIAGDLYEKPGLLEYPKRLEMLRIATDANPDFEVDTWEAEQPEFILTIDLLKHYARTNPDAEICLLCGADHLATMTTSLWRPENVIYIFENYRIFALPRELGHSAISQEQLREQLNGFFGFDIFSKIHFLTDAPHVGASSTLVRERLRTGHSVRYLVVPELYEFLRHTNYYSSPR